MKQTDQINAIIGIAERGNYFDRVDLSVRCFGLGQDAISFTGDNAAKYQDAIESLYATDRDVDQTYTLKKFEERFIANFADQLRGNTPAESEQVRQFFQELKKEVPVEYTVYRPIQGVHLNDESRRTTLGRYQIVHYPSQKDTFPTLREKESPDLVWLGDNPIYLIGCKAEARHQEKAIEIADESFARFELIVRYLIGDIADRFEVGILNYRGARLNKAYVFEPDRPAGTASNRQGAYESVPLDDPYFVNTDAGHDVIWRIASEDSVTDFQKRLLLALEWVAQAMAESSLASGFIKAAISLEILFTYNEKAIVTPSILSQISENVALLLAEDVAERIEVEREVKYLYSVRSSIVHSGKADILRDQFVRMLRIARSVIATILTRDDLLSLRKIDDLYLLLKSKKYSCGAI